MPTIASMRGKLMHQPPQHSFSPIQSTWLTQGIRELKWKYIGALFADLCTTTPLADLLMD